MLSEESRSKVLLTIRHFLSGYVSGMMLIIIGSPFDLIKTRMQTNPSFKGPIDCLLRTVRKEGILALYKGALAPMLSTGVINAFMFSSMGYCKESVSSGPASSETCAVCGLITGCLVMPLIVTPIEVVKINLMVQHAKAVTIEPPQSVKYFKGPVDCFSSILKSRGIMNGIYRGYWMTWFTRGGNMTYFGTYDYATKYLKRETRLEKDIVTLLSGSIAGVAYWLTIYPFDVIKSRVQSSTGSVSEVVRDLVRQPMHFARGLSACLARAIPVNAAAFFTYELMYNKILTFLK